MNSHGTVRRIYVRPPHADAFAAWRAYGWHADPDIEATMSEHAAFVDVLRSMVDDVVVGATPMPSTPMTPRS